MLALLHPAAESIDAAWRGVQSEVTKPEDIIVLYGEVIQRAFHFTRLQAESVSI